MILFWELRATRLITSQNATAPKQNIKESAEGDLFDYQSECHCSKTAHRVRRPGQQFDYQSECHCSKTDGVDDAHEYRLITSQNATAPKQVTGRFAKMGCLITSQNATAPKPEAMARDLVRRLITSQNATAPKPRARSAAVVRV